MPETLIAPSILSADFSNLERDVKKIEDGGANWVHVDVMDGVFVPNITIGAPVVKSLRTITKMPLDVHLMIVDPDKHVEDFIKAGADIVTVHAEACNHLDRTLSLIKSLGAKAGVSINPHSSEDSLKHVLNIADLVLVMSVNPGFGGQKFIPYTLEKIKNIKAMAEKLGRKVGTNDGDLHIEVDGGITPGAIAKEVKDAGANVLVAGSAVYNSVDIPKAISDLKQS